MAGKVTTTLLSGRGLRSTTPSGLSVPAFLMNFPFTVSNREPNNALMVDRTPYDYDRAYRQWMALYNALAEEALIYLLPHGNSDYQDLPFVANIGAFLPHRGDTIVLANFRSQPRRGEDIIGGAFFAGMGYRVMPPPAHFEGEADLKFIRGCFYVGGHGIRTDIAAYRWMAAEFDVDILPVKMTDPKLYHFDCIFFPLNAAQAIVATAALDDADVREIEKHVEIIDVPKAYLYDGWTNAVRLHGKVFVNVPPTRESRDALEDLIVRLGYEPAMINLGEFDKSGADLSCLVLHLNFNGRK